MLPGLTPLMGLALVLIVAGCGASAPDGISRAEAVNVAYDALYLGRQWGVVLAEAGPLGEVRPGWDEHEWGHSLSADLPVWRVVLGSNELSAEVVIDFIDGSVYSSRRDSGP